MNIQTIRQRLAERVRDAMPLGSKLKFHLDDEFILIDGTGSKNTVSDEDADADCTIVMSKEDYVKLQQKELKPMKAVLTGRMKIKGDTGVAKKFGEIT